MSAGPPNVSMIAPGRMSIRTVSVCVLPEGIAVMMMPSVSGLGSLVSQVIV